MGSKGQILKTLIQINTASNNSKGCVLVGDLEYPKELLKLYNNYLLAPKEKYVLHYENSQLYLRLGMKVKN